MAYGTLTLTGKHTTASKKAHAGAATVTPNCVIRDTAGDIIMSGSEQVKLAADGAWSLVLPCDDPGLNPSSGIGYTVHFALHATSLKPVSFYAIASLAGTTLDVSDIVSVNVPAPLSAIVGDPGPKGDPGVVANATLARTPDLLITGVITRDANGAATSAPVVWPDGSPGTYTALVVSSAFPGAVDSYSITYGSPVTETYTQPTVTRDANGAATLVPAITVS